MSCLAWLGLGVGVFAAALVYDFAAARYLVAQSARRYVHMANWAAVCGLMGLVGVGSVLQESRWLALPELAGIWIGTFVGARWKPDATRPPAG